MKSVLTALLLACSTACWASAQSLNVFAAVSEGDFDSLFDLDSASNTTGEHIDVSGDTIWYPFDDEIGVNEFFGSAEAEASYGSLRAAAYGEIAETYWDGNEQFNYNEFEVPSVFDSYASARFTDVFSFTGGDSFSTRFAFNVTGQLTDTFGDGYWPAYAFVMVTLDDNDPVFYDFFEPGIYDELVITDTFEHGAEATFEISLQAVFTVDTSHEWVPDTVGGSAEFLNTLDVVAMEVRDDEGTLLSGADISVGSGTGYTFAAVPEPSHFALLAGLIALAGIVLKKRYRY